MYEDEYYYETRKKENAKLDAELAGTFATVIGGLIGAVLSCLIFLLRQTVWFISLRKGSPVPYSICLLIQESGMWLSTLQWLL